MERSDPGALRGSHEVPSETSPWLAALAAHGRRDFAAAARLYRKILERQPDHVDALANLGAVLRALGGHADALDCYRKALEALEQAAALLPEMARAHLELGSALKALGRLEEVEARQRRAVAPFPTGITGSSCPMA